MDQTLDCIHFARRNNVDYEKIKDCLSLRRSSEIAVDRHLLRFDYESQTVTITRKSEDVPFAAKINGCKMPYNTLRKMLNGDFDSPEGFEWI